MSNVTEPQNRQQSPITTLLTDAAKLTQEAEKIEASITKRREEFEAKLQADLAKLEEAKRLASEKIAEAQRAMGGTAPKVSRAVSRANGKVDREAIVRWIRTQDGPVSASQVKAGVGIEASGNALSNALAALTAEGALVKTGERRGTRYVAA